MTRPRRRAVARERRHLAHLRNVLGPCASALAAEVVGQYEQPQQSIVSLIIDATSFQQLVDGLEFMSRLNHREESVISATRTAKQDANSAATRLTRLLRTDASAAIAAQAQAKALTGMTALLDSQESALGHARQAQASALAASQRGAPSWRQPSPRSRSRRTRPWPPSAPDGHLQHRRRRTGGCLVDPSPDSPL